MQSWLCKLPEFFFPPFFNISLKVWFKREALNIFGKCKYCSHFKNIKPQHRYCSRVNCPWAEWQVCYCGGDKNLNEPFSSMKSIKLFINAALSFYVFPSFCSIPVSYRCCFKVFIIIKYRSYFYLACEISFFFSFTMWVEKINDLVQLDKEIFQ